MTDLKLTKKASWLMFDKIAGSYDGLNRVISFGLDLKWRKKLALLFPKKEQLRYLDLATGTGDVILSVLNQKKLVDFRSILGMDMSKEMLAIGQKKIMDRNLSNDVGFQEGDVSQLPLDNNMFDVITIAFGIRNVDQFLDGLKEIYRVLDDDGRLLVLESSLPKNKLIRWGHLFYMKRVMPLIGGILSGEKQAYRYLHKTTEAFPYGEAFCRCLKEVGFKNVKQYPQCFGVATIYQADK